MQAVVCCCDHDDCAILRFSRREQVLETLCGICVHEYVLDASTLIQSCFRGFRLRRDKRIFDAAVRRFLTRCRRYLLARQTRLCDLSAVRIQAAFRGCHQRNTRFGRVLVLYMDERSRVRALRRHMAQINVRTRLIRNKRKHEKRTVYMGYEDDQCP